MTSFNIDQNLTSVNLFKEFWLKWPWMTSKMKFSKSSHKKLHFDVLLKGQKMDEFLRNVSDSWSSAFFFFLIFFSNFFSKVWIVWFFDRISACMSTSCFRSFSFCFLILSYADGKFDPNIFISCGISGTVPVVKIRGRHELKFGRYPVTNGFSNVLIFREKSTWAIRVERNFNSCHWRHLRRVSARNFRDDIEILVGDLLPRKIPVEIFSP